MIILSMFVVLISCGGGDRATSNRKDDRIEGTNERKLAFVPTFNADSAFYFVQRQVDFGPRVPNTEAHQKCGDWFYETLSRFADTVFVQSTRLRAFDGTILSVRNFIGAFRPDARNRILLCAHWDTRPWADYDPDPSNHFKPFDGANDGASGVGVLLELARLLSENEPNIGVDIILFDAEDYGKHRTSNIPDQDSWALGSQYWSRNPHVSDYNARFGILLDMVGASNATFKKEGYSMMYAPNIVRDVWNIARKQGFGHFFINREGGFIIDDHYYINKIRGIPVINIIDQRDHTSHGFFDYWHTLNDTMYNIDRETLRAVGQTVAAVVWQQ